MPPGVAEAAGAAAHAHGTAGAQTTHEDSVLALNIGPPHDPFPDDAHGEETDEVPETTLHLWDEDSDADDAPPPRAPHALLPIVRHAPLPNVAQWWRTLLIGSATPGTLSTGHVAMNMLGSSLHPGVLLAMPVYFSRTGVVSGMLVVILVAILAVFGGALWITLGRYVGGAMIEGITGRAFGMHTQWKRNLGSGMSSIVLIVYCTGAAVIAYHAMTDLLLQVLFHYSVPGGLLHNRAFVTLFVGGLLVRIPLTQTLPLLVSTTPKRNIIQMQSWFTVLCYPLAAAVLYVRMHAWHTPLRRPPSLRSKPSASTTVPMPRWDAEASWPWATTALTPLLLLSALPAQILAHSRSLRRKAVYDSNVRSFFLAQLVQTASMLVIVYVFGVDIGMVGSAELQQGLHANFFGALPLDDDHVNVARGLFTLLLAAHLSVCLASARSSWSRLLNLLNVHPLRSMQPPTPQFRGGMSRSVSGTSMDSPRWLPPPWRSPGPRAWGALDNTAAQEERAYRRFKFLRSSLSGTVLWAVTAGIAYVSGVGGFLRRSEKEGEELRFLRSTETVGILGTVVGLLLPAVIWLVLFHIRRPRAILMLQSNSMRARISRYLLGPLSALIPLAHPSEAEHLMHSAAQERDTIPSHENEESPSTRDDATLILLARKERALQRQTRGYVAHLHTVAAYGKN